ncbi:MAG TPA: histidine kinase [Aurantimonas coralicida]|uniref:Histidine kinase n=2 Tax=root TaxID=1 RepID=A0A9C9NDF4_9HYPH|nr:histidine kinase [Aurantimonas coralicida]HET99440.1 histidine kinase [Aurantimonas coralicida]
MLRSLRLLIIFVVFLATPVLAQAPRGSRDEAIAMVTRVQVMFKAQGAAATFAAINDLSNPEFHDRDLYPFVYDLEGVNVAHGARPVLVGKNLSSLKDQDGKYLIQEIIGVATGPGSGWVDYKWPHPITNKIEDKSSYIEKLGAYVVGVGIYKN